MDAYHLTLFVHLCAVITAGAAASLAVFTGGRYARALSYDDAHAWLELNGKVTITFPIVLIVLLVSGSYMVTLTGGGYWATAWVRTGITAVVTIFAIGGFSGKRHKALERRLADMTDVQRHAQPFHPPRDPLLAVLPWVNICFALGVVFLMTNKPSVANTVTIAIASIAVGLLIGYRTLAKGRAAAAAAATASD